MRVYRRARADQLEGLEILKEKAEANGVPVEIWDREKTVALEANVADDIAFSLYAPTAA